jgi:hypothetical protein
MHERQGNSRPSAWSFCPAGKLNSYKLNPVIIKRTFPKGRIN